MKKPELCIGTVQFGTKYGITNENGIVNLDEAKRIFSRMKENNVRFIDTAQSYGIAEKVIGKLVTYEKNNFKIISKINPIFINQLEIDSLKSYWSSLLKESLDNLNQNYLEGLLLHSPEGLTEKQKNILQEWLCEIKEKKFVKKIGLSIYEESDINGFDLDFIDIIQLPFSIYDNRLMKTGFLKFINKKGIEIYARSIFLQGLILNNCSKWPSWIRKSDRNKHQEFLKFLKNKNISSLEAALTFVSNSPYIHKIVVGISSLIEMDQILMTLKKIENKKNDFFDLPVDFSNEILDPRKWPRNEIL